MKLPLLIPFVIATAISGFSQTPTPTPNTQDRLITVEKGGTGAFDAAIKPYVELAKKSYPDAKKRFLAGLPAKNTFYVTTRLRDDDGKFEQVFIAVTGVGAGKISGTIASDIDVVKRYKAGDAYSFPEDDLIDWTIVRADGSEEGNFVGKFLDSRQTETPTDSSHVVSATNWRNSPATPDYLNERIEAAALKYRSDGPIARIAFTDIGYPRNNEEVVALDANAVLMVTAITQAEGDLPVVRTYFKDGNREVDLKQLSLRLSKADGAAESSKTFGIYRMDALYLLPISLRKASGSVFIDFGNDRKAFKILETGTPLAQGVAALSNDGAKGTGPSPDALRKFLDREFPTFGDQ